MHRRVFRVAGSMLLIHQHASIHYMSLNYRQKGERPASLAAGRRACERRCPRPRPAREPADGERAGDEANRQAARPVPGCPPRLRGPRPASSSGPAIRHPPCLIFLNSSSCLATSHNTPEHAAVSDASFDRPLKPCPEFRIASADRVKAEQRQEPTSAVYSIISSADTMIEFGTVNPSVLAVFILTTISNLVGRSIGKSDGGVPLRTRST